MNERDIVKIMTKQSAMEQDIKYIRSSIDDIKKDFKSIMEIVTKNRSMIVKMMAVGGTVTALVLPVIIEWIKTQLA